MTKIILASGSPRRKELMSLLPLAFQIKTKEVEELIDVTKSPSTNVCSLATQKAVAVAVDYPQQWVIGCDTVVVYEGHILGKPKDEADAKRMLRMLAGKSHEVYTGVSIIQWEQKVEQTFFVSSQVRMKRITEEEINAYVKCGEPMDKAGSYAIQGKGAVFIEGIEGDYFNIVGLPLSRLYDELKKLEIISQ